MGPLPIIALLSVILLLIGIPLMVSIYGIIKNHIKYNEVIRTYQACQNETYKPDTPALRKL
jgi:CHASE3 domain sensor protein